MKVYVVVYDSDIDYGDCYNCSFRQYLHVCDSMEKAIELVKEEIDDDRRKASADCISFKTTMLDLWDVYDCKEYIDYVIAETECKDQYRENITHTYHILETELL